MTRFLRVPGAARWLATAVYLHELTIFPCSKHDDQVHSTAQMLDWFKQAGGEPRTIRYYRVLADGRR